ncbi:MAG: helix-turn-helix domain-containing protein [Bacteroidota bacterium]
MQSRRPCQGLALKTNTLISREYLFFVSLLGVINGLFLTGYFLLGKKDHRYVNVYLGLLLLALVIRIGKSVFFHFDSGLNEVYIHIGLLGCTAIGPMCWYFARSQVSGNKQFDPRSLWHLLPLLALTVYAVFFVSYDENRRLWSGYIVRGIYAYLGLYTLAALAWVVYWRWIKKVRFAENIWTQGVVLGVFLIWVAYVTSSFTSYLTGSFTFSFLVYLLAGILLNQLRDRKPKRVRKQPPEDALTTAGVSQIKDSIARVLTKEERFKDPDLTMPLLAEAIGLTPHQFSLFINEHLGQNFSQLVNAHRIGAAKEMLLDQPHLTVEAIGYDSGFNSPSTFYTAFKKATGMTPAAYKKQVSVSSDL